MASSFHLIEVAPLEGHQDRVWAAAWAPSGALLATCGGDKSVRIWGQEGGHDSKWVCKSVLEESHLRTVRAVDWSPCGRFLATGSFDATTAIWEHTGAEFEMVATLEGHENEVKSVAWSPSGRLLATCSRDKSVWVWEVQPGGEFECAAVLPGHSQDVKMVRWQPEREREVLVSASYDDSIKVWADDGDDDWHCLQTLDGASSGHSSTVWAVAFDASGDRMVSCSDDCTLKLWDTRFAPDAGPESGRWCHITTVSGYHDRTIFSCDWSWPNGMFATGAGDDAIRIFAVGPDADSQSMASSVGLVLKKEKAHLSDVNCVAWHPKDPRLMVSTGDDGIARIWRLEGELGLGN